MSAAAQTSRGALRWGGAFVLALLAHGGLAAALLTRSPPPPDALPSDAITLDLEAEPSDTAHPDDVAGPEMTDSVEPAPEPEPASDPEPPAPDSPPPQLAETRPPAETAPPDLTAPPAPGPSEAVLPPTPEQPPEPRPPREVAEAKPEPEVRPPEAREERRTAPSQARSATAALIGGGGRPSAAQVATWGAKLGKHLAQHKRYPVQARARRQQGTAMLQVALDGEGRVVSRKLVRSSGSSLLDEESLSLVLRAQPLPKPPPNMAVPITLTIPVQFTIQ